MSITNIHLIPYDFFVVVNHITWGNSFLAYVQANSFKAQSLYSSMLSGAGEAGDLLVWPNVILSFCERLMPWARWYNVQKRHKNNIQTLMSAIVVEIMRKWCLYSTRTLHCSTVLHHLFVQSCDVGVLWVWFVYISALPHYITYYT